MCAIYFLYPLLEVFPLGFRSDQGWTDVLVTRHGLLELLLAEVVCFQADFAGEECGKID